VATEPSIDVGVGGVEEGADDLGVDVGSVGPGFHLQQLEEADTGVYIAGVATCGAFREVRDVVPLKAQFFQKAVRDPRVVLGIGQDAFDQGDHVLGDALVQVLLVEGPGEVSGPAQALAHA
jgi:hypothetical protein